MPCSETPRNRTASSGEASTPNPSSDTGDRLSAAIQSLSVLTPGRGLGDWGPVLAGSLPTRSVPRSLQDLALLGRRGGAIPVGAEPMGASPKLCWLRRPPRAVFAPAAVCACPGSRRLRRPRVSGFPSSRSGPRPSSRLRRRRCWRQCCCGGGGGGLPRSPPSPSAWPCASLRRARRTASPQVTPLPVDSGSCGSGGGVGERAGVRRGFERVGSWGVERGWGFWRRFGAGVGRVEGAGSPGRLRKSGGVEAYGRLGRTVLGLWPGFGDQDSPTLRSEDTHGPLRAFSVPPRDFLLLFWFWRKRIQPT